MQQGDSRLDSGELVDTYVFRGRAGQRVDARLSSGDFDPYLMIRGPSGFSQENDDAGSGGTDSALDVRLPADGEYRLMATSFEAGETGRYALSLDVRGAGGGGRDQGGYTQSIGGGGGRPPASSGAAGGGEARVGDANAGFLGGGDQRLDTGEYTDTWTLRGRPGARYTARLNAGDFDAYLMARGDGVSEDNDDDPSGRGDRNSRLEFIMPRSGEVELTTTSYQPRETGAYTLWVEEDGDGRNQGGGRPAPQTPATGNLMVGGDVSGRLASGSSQLRSGEYADGYALRGRRGDRLDLRLTSTQFDPYLFITGPGDFTAANDDDDSGEDGTNSRLIVTLPADGEYRVVATSYKAGETGGYRLAAAMAGRDAPPPRPDRPDAWPEPEDRPAPPRPNASGPILVDQRGSLSRGDATLEDGEYADRFNFRARRGDRIAGVLESSDFDAYLSIQGPNDQQYDNDDGPDGTNSRVDAVLQADGEYTAMVTSFEGGETGAYRLTVAPSNGSPRQQDVQGGPRVFAVMIGVTDYGGEQPDLPYTAEDADKLGQALRREGVLNPASITLTNAQATVGGVRAAFNRVAEQAGPDDVFLFFFSGHGNQIDGQTSAMEPDGKTETLVLRDGEISDVELGEMFGRLRTRMSMLVLDSCFSGGFARNVVSRPGTLGLFSSEEDLTSQVADKFEAGGYLSHFLRTGMAGAANLDGDDMITAGELSTYLRRQFAREVTDVEAETQDGQRSYQNLVVDRGGVQVDDVVLRL
ncbi:hypothetical protein ASG17_05815 [Brevundimonas sp. Leaf363]|nr:hypothetical protein ASG17_05815 [Brevundimonas sp. Leaf363]